MLVHCTIDQPKTLKLREVNTNDHLVTMQRPIGKLLDLAFMENVTLTHTTHLNITVAQTTRPQACRTMCHTTIQDWTKEYDKESKTFKLPSPIGGLQQHHGWKRGTSPQYSKGTLKGPLSMSIRGVSCFSSMRGADLIFGWRF